MESVILVLMVLVCFNFILKQTFNKWYWVILISAVCFLFPGFMWPYAIAQSKSQIALWLADSALMLDISLILTIEVALQMSFCILAADLKSSGRLRRKKIWLYRVLRWFPGLLIFPVLFCALTAAIFSYPGTSFTKVAWCLGAAFGLAVHAGRVLFKLLFPMKEMRLELLFLTNALIAILGIIATVNGRTAVEGTAQINWSALAGLLLLVIAGTVTGEAIWCIKIRKQIKNL